MRETNRVVHEDSFTSQHLKAFLKCGWDVRKHKLLNFSQYIVCFLTFRPVFLDLYSSEELIDAGQGVLHGP